MRIVDPKCPQCGAPLPVHPEAAVVTCTYCATQFVVDRGRRAARPPEHRHLPVVRVAAQGGLALGIGAAVAILSLIGGLVAAGAAIVGSAARGGSSSGLLGPPHGRFSDRPMLADVNRDGVPDLVGKSDQPSGEAWIAAYDGKSGAELWRTASLSKDAADTSARRAIVDERIVSIDALGKVQAYDLHTGGPLWAASLGEKAKRVCRGDGGAIVVQTADDARHGLEPATGRPRELAKGAACASVAGSDRDEAPGYRIVGWPEFDKLGIPGLHDIDGMMAHRALIPAGAGPRFMLGARSKGTEVAMVAAVDGKKVLWTTLVPGVEALTTTVNVLTQEAAYVNGLLVVPYDMKDSNAGVRMACFDGATGRRLWDVQVHHHTQVASGLAVTPSVVFFASWTAAYALSLKTGKPLFLVGTEF
jgi:outer membrane protein assembly factor BamB